MVDKTLRFQAKQHTVHTNCQLFKLLTKITAHLSTRLLLLVLPVCMKSLSLSLSLSLPLPPQQDQHWKKEAGASTYH